MARPLYFPGVERRPAFERLDSINRGTWRRPATVATYRRLHGWTDPGEGAAMRRLAPQVRGERVLDIGVGVGRTTEWLQPIAGDYLGIDYVPEMVEAARAAHPGVRFEQMDARDLSSLPAESFGFVMFSFNGIDAVPPADRPRVLAQVRRVLRPGGLFLMSAHNRWGPGVRERPGLHVPFSANPIKLAWRMARALASLPRAIANHMRLRGANAMGEDWAVMNCGAHDFGLVIVYASASAQQRQLRQAGFEVLDVFDSEQGESLLHGSARADAWWFHYVARKP